MKNSLIIFLTILVKLVYSQTTTITTASINKYANVITINYCDNALGVPSGMGGQFSIGDKILIIQMKGATLVEGNNNPLNGQVDSYNNAGNYEINEIKSINSGLNDEIVFKYEIEREYNVSGSVQIVTIPQYNNVIIQNTLTCLAWNGDFGGVLTFNATGTVTMNANIDVSEKGFRGGFAEDVSGTGCYSAVGFNDYNCDYLSICGALKGEGIGNRTETKELARSPNANGGGGGNDHNAGGGGGASIVAGGKGGDMTNGNCVGHGALGGVNLEYNSSLNKMFFTGAGGAGDAGNSDGTTGATSGGHAGGLVFVSANSLVSNNFKIISNGKNITDLADGDGGGGGGAGGLIVLNANSYSNVIVESLGGFGGNVTTGTNCEGPGGGGAGGLLWLKQNTTPSDVSLNADGGNTGFITFSTAAGNCTGDVNGALPGDTGSIVFNFSPIVSSIEFARLKLIAGDDTSLCGKGVAPLWAEASSSIDFNFKWEWSSGTESALEFDFNPEYGGNYEVKAIASFEKFGQGCEETWLVHVDVNKPHISIVANSFFGDTVNIGEVVFLNALITPSININTSTDSTYSWMPSEQIDPENERNTIATPYETGDYCLTVKNKGCENTECVKLFVREPRIISPDAFTPNNDNINNSFLPILTQDLKMISFKVYNRWGDLVYITDEKIAWNGKKNNEGEDLGSDQFTWFIQVEQILSKKYFTRTGVVTLIR